MQEKDFLSVKDVAEMLETEAYVLRFYEKELNLNIKRNSKGHRVYTLEDVELFRKIQEMREQGLQLKAIETIVHDESSEEAKETYEQLSGISLSPVSNLIPAKNHQVPEIDITDTEDEKVKQFSCLMKEMLKQALMECNEQSKEAMRETIKEEVNTVVEEKVTKLQEEQDAKNEEYYRKLDETMREVQKMRKEMSQKEEEAMSKKEKPSFWSRLFKDKNESAQM